jgi:two-component system, cell cycle sensor histidine kinase and response regulator CckA
MTRLLVVDDNEQNRYLLQALLTGHGYEVVLAAEGAEALEKARENPPDVIITDILMPGMDGYALCRQWKRDEKLKQVPLVFYTATYTDPRDEDLALSLGADRFIIKPQEPDVFMKAIEEVVEERQVGRLTPIEPALEETVYFKEYNEALIRKLEDKLVELESAKASLECEVAERREAEESLALHAKRVQALLDLQQLSYAQEDQVMDFVLDACLSITESAYSFVGTVDEAESLMTIHRWSKETMAECALPAQPIEYPICAAGLWADCVRERTPVICNDYHAPHPNKKGLPERHVDIHRFAAVPVVDGERIVVVAAVANKTRDYVEADISAMSTLLQKMWEILSRQRREREREMLEKQYRQAQKMEAIGQLAGGVAHDFNNILHAMMGYSNLLLDRLPENEENHEFALEIARGAGRAAALTRQLLTFSRRQVIQPENLDLNLIVEELLKMLRRVIGEDIRLEWIPGKQLGVIHADAGMMEQVLMNLCVNARDAMEHGGVVTIETQNVVLDSEYCLNHLWATPGRFVLLSVTDTGRGMDKDTMERIFEPFFTTKGPGKGTGLGLATVYGIIRQHGGMINLYSEPGKGTTFKVYLPLCEEEAATVSPLIEAPAAGGNEIILLAEDDQKVRELAERILKQAGYTVLAAKDGEEAVALFKENADGVALLLLDVVMPNLGGHEAFEQIRGIRPGIPALFSSGYSEQAVHTNFVLHEGLQLIQKPYAPNALLRKVREILDRTSGKMV